MLCRVGFLVQNEHYLPNLAYSPISWFDFHYLFISLFLFWNNTYGNKAEEGAELVSLVRLELLAQRGEDVLDLGKGDFAGAVLVEDLKAKDKA